MSSSMEVIEMKRSYEDLKTELKARNIRLSHQRLKVLEYLNDHMVHPTVDQIYRDLQDEIPTLSRTTVYSTLDALAEAGMVRRISIEDTETRYDINIEDHGHFKCESCGMIRDFKAEPQSMAADELPGFVIRDRNVYFKGTCPECLAAANQSGGQ